MGRYASGSRAERRRFFDEIRELPSVTRDGVPITLSINAAFLVDLAEMLTLLCLRAERAALARPAQP